MDLHVGLLLIVIGAEVNLLSFACSPAFAGLFLFPRICFGSAELFGFGLSCFFRTRSLLLPLFLARAARGVVNPVLFCLPFCLFPSLGILVLFFDAELHASSDGRARWQVRVHLRRNRKCS